MSRRNARRGRPVRGGDGAGRVATARAGGVVAVHDGSLALTRAFHAHAGGTTTLAWAPGGDRLLTGGRDGAVRRWTVGDTVDRTATVDLAARVSAVAWHPDGDRYAAAGRDGRVVVRGPDDAGTDLPRGDEVRALAWSPDGDRLAIARPWGDPPVLVRDAAGRRVRDVAAAAVPDVHAVAWAPDGRRLAVASDARALVVDAGAVGDAAPTVVRDASDGRDGWLTALAWAPGGDGLALCGPGVGLALWDADRRATRGLPLDARGPVDLAWNAAGTDLVVGSRRRRLHRYRVADAALLATGGPTASDELSALAWERP